MRAVIVGGGIAGLTAALRLARAGHAVTVLEREEALGGLARSFPIGDGFLDRYYHFICRADRELFDLLRELGIRDRLRWVNSRMGQFHQGVLYPFGEPWDLLTFTPFTPLERLRFGVGIMGVKTRGRDGWKALADVPAATWLLERFGRRAYEVVYEPLLRLKFGRHADRISAAWVWSRFHRVGKSRTLLAQRELLGYLEGGMRSLVDALAGRIAAAGGEIRPGTPALKIVTERGAVAGVSPAAGDLRADTVISTIPPPTLLRLLAPTDDAYFANLRTIDSIGVLCVLLVLDRPFSPFFWTNVSDPGMPLAGIIEFTRLDSGALPGGGHVLYLPAYIPADDPRFCAPDSAVLAEALGWLKRINPAFEEGWVRSRFVFRDDYAQPICGVGFASHVPSLTSSVRGLIVTDSSQLHPEDRTVANSIGLGIRAAALAGSGGD
jgi:protoporphyrinogen oxidase